MKNTAEPTNGETSQWIWHPRLGAGPARFGVSLAQLDGVLALEELPDEHYDFPDGAGSSRRSLAYRPHGRDDVRMYFSAGVLDSMAFYESLLWRGLDLIGSSLAEVEAVSGRAPDVIGEAIEVGAMWQHTAEFDDLGLMLWLVGERVVSVSINSGSA